MKYFTFTSENLPLYSNTSHLWFISNTSCGSHCFINITKHIFTKSGFRNEKRVTFPSRCETRDFISSLFCDCFCSVDVSWREAQLERSLRHGLRCECSTGMEESNCFPREVSKRKATPPASVCTVKILHQSPRDASHPTAMNSNRCIMVQMSQFTSAEHARVKSLEIKKKQKLLLYLRMIPLSAFWLVKGCWSQVHCFCMALKTQTFL